jgi:tetratricopeptide (TPR) repeat protein
MNKDQNKLMTDLHRLLNMQDFKSEADVQKFMEGIIGQQISSLPEDILNPQEQAQDLVYEAYDLSTTRAKQNIKKALKFDNNCIEAYEFLGHKEDIAEIAILFYEKAIKIGRENFKGNFLEKNKGKFWYIHETRPFMRCLKHYSDCLYSMEKPKEAVAILEEIIDLNENDNQGVRDQLLLYLILLEENKKFEKYAQMFKDDDSTFSLFNRALFAFKTEGETDNTNKQLQSAIKQNKFVVAKLLSKKTIISNSEHYSWGGEDEANYYAEFAKYIWENTNKATLWLKKHTI